jgi:hypothetical protein
MPTQDYYPANSNPLAPSWRLAQYAFPEIPSGYCIEKASYYATVRLAPEASVFAQEMPIDRNSDFIWNEWRFGLIDLAAATTYPNIKVRLRDSKGRRIMNDLVEVPQCCGMVMCPMIFLAGTSMYIDATADDAGATTITFQLVFKGFKRFQG